MQKDEVYALMFEIMKKILYDALLTKDDFDKGLNSPLTGDYWNLNALQLVYLFCETEKDLMSILNPINL